MDRGDRVDAHEALMIDLIKLHRFPQRHLGGSPLTQQTTSNNTLITKVDDMNEVVLSAGGNT
jgi:hypothetical protein